MIAITQPIISKRANNATLNFHVVSENLVVNTTKKIVMGQVRSFKTDKILDSMDDTGNIVPATTQPFIIENVNLQDIDATVSAFITANLEKIVG